MIASSKILITDFDGTLTRRDFYDLAVNRYLRDNCPDYWTLYATGRATHFEAMRGYFSHLDCGMRQMEELLDELTAGEGIAAAVAELREDGWEVEVVSNGCAWYIERALERWGVRLRVHACPGEFEPGRGLRMDAPQDSPYFNPSYGLDKAALVRDAQTRYRVVAFAGNGPPDLGAALAAPAEVRFARTWLAQELTRLGQPYRAFDRWTEVATALRRPRSPGR